MSESIVNILIIILCVAAQGFFSGSEMTILSSDRIKLRKESAKGSKGARRALKIMKNSRWFLATTSTGTNLFVIIASVISAAWFNDLFGENGEIMTIVIMSPFFLMFGEIIPRTIFHQRATDLAPKISPFLWVASRIISPITFLIFKTGKLFCRRIIDEPITRRPFVTSDELELILNVSEADSELEKKEKKLLHRVFRLGKSNVSEIMVPLVNVTALRMDATVSEAISVIKDAGYSRLPVYKNRIDGLCGVIHAFDLIAHPKPDQTAIECFVRGVVFAPETKRAEDLLVSLQKSKNSMAIVVDEYGGAIGVITIEDILEEVVGEIQDEHDPEVWGISAIDQTHFLAKAGIDIEEINEVLNLNLPKEDYETLGGFILKRTGRIPDAGESFTFSGIHFTIKKADRRAIHEIIVKKPDARPRQKVVLEK